MNTRPRQHGRFAGLALTACFLSACTAAAPAAPTAAPASAPASATAAPAAPAGGSTGADLTGGKQLTIYFVGVAAPTGFHGYIARAATDAGANMNAKVVYIYPDKAEVALEVQKVEQALAAKPDGIVINALGEDNAYSDVLARAAAAGIPVGSAAAPPPKAGPVKTPGDPFLFRVGSDEYAAGQLTGQRLLSQGVKGRVLVGDQQPADTTCRARAQGEIDVLQAAGVTADFTTLTMDPGQQADTITQYLRAHPDTTAATSICDVVDGFLTAKTQANRTDLIITGYDIVSQSLTAIQNGQQSFTIDQQQYWRGYVPVMLLIHYIRYGLVEANYFLTGPTVVDKTNVERVSKLVQAGFR
jgi:simple sugar transport system substrate-binding protein